ncbi:MAG: protease complex subunit PrcB family protein [Gemmatimonadota bacterium]|nr:protease complex subunit PrcB family protein [Gemmatimonadota bacterium]
MGRVRHWGLLLTLAGTLVADAAAQAVPDSIRGAYPALPPGAASVPFEVVRALSTPMSSIDEPVQQVLGTETQWRAWWTRFYSFLAPIPEPPAFEEGRVAAVIALGRMPSAGYHVGVEGVFDADGERWIAVRMEVPGPTCIVSQVQTAPATAVWMPPSRGPVRFLERRVERSC